MAVKFIAQIPDFTGKETDLSDFENFLSFSIMTKFNIRLYKLLISIINYGLYIMITAICNFDRTIYSICYQTFIY